MKKNLLFFAIFLIIFSASVYAFNIDQLAPEKIFGISSGMDTQQIIVAVATWVVVFFFVYGILRIFLGGFLGLIAAFAAIIAIGYLGLLSVLFKNAVQIATGIGVIGVGLIIIGAMIVAFLFHLSSNRLVIWWQTMKMNARARRIPLIFIVSALFFIFLILSQSVISAEDVPGIPNIPGQTELPYALNRSESVFLKTYESFIKGLDSACNAIKPVTKYIIGQECSISWGFFFFVLFWIVFLSVIYEALTVFASFSSLPALAISLGISIIAATSGALQPIATIINTATKSPKNALYTVLIFIILLAAFVFLAKHFAKAKIKAKEEKVALEKEKLTTFTKSAGI